MGKVSFLAEVFNDNTDPHRVISFSNYTVYEFQHLRVAVYRLYNVLRYKYRTTVYIDANSPFFFLVGVLAALFANKNIIAIGDNITEHAIRRKLDYEDIVLTDGFRPSFYGHGDIITISYSLCHELSAGEVIAVPNLDIDNLSFALARLGLDEQFEYGMRTIRSIEDEVLTMINGLPGDLSDTVYTTSLPTHHGFNMLHCIIGGFLSKRAFLEAPLLDEHSLVVLSTMKYVFFTTKDFLKNVANYTLLSSASLVLTVGSDLPRAVAMQAMQVFQCPVLQSIGFFKSGCIGYNDVMERYGLVLFTGINYHFSAQQTLVIDSSFLGECKFDTKLVIEQTDKGLALHGDLRRSIEINGQIYFLEDVEQKVMDTNMVINAVAFVLEDDEEQYIGLVVEAPASQRDYLSASKYRGQYIIDLRDELAGRLPECLIPRKVRFVDRILYDDNGMINYNLLRTAFDNPNRPAVS